MANLRPEREANRATLIRHILRGVFPILKPDGVWVAPDPAPLSAEEVEQIFEQVAQMEPYDRQHLCTPTEDGWIVDLHNGIVSKERQT